MLREKGKGLIGRYWGGGVQTKLCELFTSIHSEKELWSTGNTKSILVDHDRFPLLQQTATIACIGPFTGNT